MFYNDQAYLWGLMYELTTHAKIRIVERKITPDELAAALAAPARRLRNQRQKIMHFDRRSRVALYVATPLGRAPQIVTVVRVHQKQIRRMIGNSVAIEIEDADV